MPGGDGTGPTGMGPMTGRAAGYCAGLPNPGFISAPGGRGFRGRGFGGGGRGRRNWFYATGLTGRQRAAAGMPAFGAAPLGDPAAVSKEQELNLLKQQAQIIEQQMKQLQERIQQLQTEEPAQ